MSAILLCAPCGFEVCEAETEELLGNQDSVSVEGVTSELMEGH